MLSYASFTENPSSFLQTFLVSLVITLFAYCAFPLIFANMRKKTISAKKYRLFCYAFNFLIMFFFLVINGKSSGVPYILWTMFFSKLGTAILEDRHVLEKEPEDDPNRMVMCTSCGYQSSEYFEACPRCGKHQKEYVYVNTQEATASATFEKKTVEENTHDTALHSAQSASQPHSETSQSNFSKYSMSFADDTFASGTEGRFYGYELRKQELPSLSSTSAKPQSEKNISKKKPCPRCGQALMDNAEVCPYCGYSVGSFLSVPAKEKATCNEPATITKSSPEIPAPTSRKKSNIGLWVLIILLTVGLGVSLFFNYSQHNELVAKQELVDELLSIEETEKIYRNILDSMQKVNAKTYKKIGTFLDQLSINYLNTSTIHSEYIELKKYFKSLESWSTAPNPYEMLRTTYTNLYNFNIKHTNWDLSDYLTDEFFTIYFKNILKGREWSDGEYYFHWQVEDDAEYLLTDLPTNQKSWISYDYNIIGSGKNMVLESENSKNTSDTFYTYKILDVYYSGGKWNLKIYCYADDTTYILH